MLYSKTWTQISGKWTWADSTQCFDDLQLNLTKINNLGHNLDFGAVIDLLLDWTWDMLTKMTCLYSLSPATSHRCECECERSFVSVFPPCDELPSWPGLDWRMDLTGLDSRCDFTLLAQERFLIHRQHLLSGSMYC